MKKIIRAMPKRGSNKPQKNAPACINPIALLRRLEGLRGDEGGPLTIGRIEFVGDSFILVEWNGSRMIKMKVESLAALPSLQIISLCKLVSAIAIIRRARFGCIQCIHPHSLRLALCQKLLPYVCATERGYVCVRNRYTLRTCVPCTTPVS